MYESIPLDKALPLRMKYDLHASVFGKTKLTNHSLHSNFMKKIKTDNAIQIKTFIDHNSLMLFGS